MFIRAIIFLLFLVQVDSFAMGRMGAMRAAYGPKVGNRRTRERREKEREIQEKLKEERSKMCDYVNKRFPYTRTTCSVPPEPSFRYVYGKDPALALWEEQQNHCVPRELNIWSVLLFFGSIFIGMCLFMSTSGSELGGTPGSPLPPPGPSGRNCP